MLRLGAVVLQVSDVARAREFWSAALGREGHPRRPEFLSPDDAAPGTALHLDAEDRTHLDLWADDATDQQVQVARLVALGARRVEWDYPPGADFVVLADPDGNLFCVIAPGPGSASSPTADEEGGRPQPPGNTSVAG